MERTLIKFGCFWRKISRKDGCRGVSESAHDFSIQYNKFSAARQVSCYPERAASCNSSAMRLLARIPRTRSAGHPPYEDLERKMLMKTSFQHFFRSKSSHG